MYERHRQQQRRGPTWLLLIVGGIALAIQAYAGGIALGSFRGEPSPLIAALGTIILLGYLKITEPHMLRMVGNPRFWVMGLVLAGLSGLVLGETSHHVFGVPISQDGLKAGLIVVLRASILMSLVMALSSRISPDWLVRMFNKAGMPQAGGAFALGVELLPHMVTSWQRGVSRSPSAQRPPLFNRLARLIVSAADLADEIVRDLDAWTAPRKKARLFIVTGPVGAGKTGVIAEVLERARVENLRVGGFLQPAVFTDQGERNGYNLRLLPGDVEITLARQGEDALSRWQFDEKAFASAALHLQALENTDLFIVDEIGRMERNGHGHWPAIARKLPQTGGVWLLSLREGMEDNVLARLGYSKALRLDDPRDSDSRRVFIQALIDAVLQSRAGTER